MKTAFITFTFLVLAVLPSGANSEPTTDMTQCLREIKTHWIPKASVNFTGLTRTETPCMLQMGIDDSTLTVQATGNPLQVTFQLSESEGTTIRTLQTCRVDKEKIHFAFEERTTLDFEKRERVQMTLLKRHGKGLSLILSKRENKILRPLQQSSLICHLN